ncbi:hypothetical protein [Burkholderia pseudomallei]|uniref:hypothetical protein n=1 Tax=Burkholderia pseudomallei TaxID=28450 RepID=UPI0012F50040|nr:hypothetical protein [Burkholderia pseudomallei]
MNASTAADVRLHIFATAKPLMLCEGLRRDGSGLRTVMATTRRILKLPERRHARLV